MSEKFDKTEVQRSLLESLISSPDTFSICENIIQHEYFNPELSRAVKFIKEYYTQYNEIPELFQIKAESGAKLNKVDITKSVSKWTEDNVEAFAKYKATVLAVQDSLEDISKGNYAELGRRVQLANEISITKDIGFEYFKTVEERVQRMSNEPPTISTGWNCVDKTLFGGIARKELILFAGASGVGKSFTLANLGMNFLKRKLNVLFLSLELSEDRVSQRFDQMITGISGAKWRFETDKIIKGVKSSAEGLGELTIKQLPAGTTPNEMRAYLKQFNLQKGYRPDLFIVDYLDEMKPNEKVSADNIAEKDKLCASALRQIGVDFDMAVATASQLNREAVEAPIINHSHIAGGMGKIRISDVTIAIRMDEGQKHRGIMEFYFLKTRSSDGVYTKHLMHWNPVFVTISDPNTSNVKDDEEPLGFKRKGKSTITIEKDEIGTSKNQVSNDMLDNFDKFLPNI